MTDMMLRFYHGLRCRATWKWICRGGVLRGMALNPEQASQLTPSNFDEVQKMEKDLDTRLLDSFNIVLGRYDYAFLKKDMPAKIPLKVIFELQRRYVLSGWEVTLVRDGEECTGMVLIAPNSPPLPALQALTVHQRLMAKENA